ncbi:hypothetical protein [Pontimicrobium sp. MEBiC01747]
MKHIIASIALLICALQSNAQQDEIKQSVLIADTTWLEEVIPFPIRFAPEIKYQGFEDLRFAKHWSDKTHPEFWSYLFTWHVKGEIKPTVETLETNLKHYYNGLMGVVNKDKTFKVPDSNILFIETETLDKSPLYVGKAKIYDSFHTKTIITFNIQVTYRYCKVSNTSDIIFKLSPQAFNHNIWQRFKTIKFKENTCY